MAREMLKRPDRMILGFVIGIMLPLVVFFAVYYFEKKDTSLSQYINGLWQLNALIKLMSLCVFINLGVFWYFLRKKHEASARGVLGATLFYAFLVLISRLI